MFAMVFALHRFIYEQKNEITFDWTKIKPHEVAGLKAEIVYYLFMLLFKKSDVENLFFLMQLILQYSIIY